MFNRESRLAALPTTPFVVKRGPRTRFEFVRILHPDRPDGAAGYQGESSRSSIHRHSGTCFSTTTTGIPAPQPNRQPRCRLRSRDRGSSSREHSREISADRRAVSHCFCRLALSDGLGVAFDKILRTARTAPAIVAAIAQSEKAIAAVVCTNGVDYSLH